MCLLSWHVDNRDLEATDLQLSEKKERKVWWTDAQRSTFPRRVRSVERAEMIPDGQFVRGNDLRARRDGWTREVEITADGIDTTGWHCLGGMENTDIDRNRT